MSDIFILVLTFMYNLNIFLDSPKIRTDLSHKIHADNCNILKNQTCVKAFPAFTWRDYSAILYLNDDFEGGEFIFSSDLNGLNIQVEIL